MTSRHDGEFAGYMAARLPALRRLAFLLCQDWHRADDLAQAAAIKAYTHWARAARAAVQAVIDAPVAPPAIELDWPSAAASISASALLEGDEPTVADRASRLVQLLERAVPGQSPVHTKRTGDRPAHRALAGSGEEPSCDGSPEADWAGADGGAAVGPFRVVRPLPGGHGSPRVARAAAEGGQFHA